MKIRFAQEKDVPQLVGLCALHAEYEQSGYDPTNKLEALKKYLFNSQNPVRCLVVETEGELMGYASFIKQFSTWEAGFYIYLDCLYLKESIRGHGIGTKLMEQVKGYGISEGCHLVQWQTPDFNENAIAFYQKLGASSKTKERFFWTL